MTTLASIVNDEPPMPAWRTRAVMLLKFTVAIALLTWLFTSGRLHIARLASINPSLRLGGLIGLSLGAMILPMLRWWWLLRIQHLYEPPWRVIALSWASSFVGLVLPGAASSDVAKSYLILRHRPRARARAFSTVLADRFLGLYSIVSLGFIAFVSLELSSEPPRSVQVMAAGVIGLFSGMSCIGVCLLASTTRSTLLRILPAGWQEAWNESFDLYWAGRWSLLGCYLLSAASSAMTFGSFSLAGDILGEVVPWSASFMAGPLVVLANCLPLTPGGVGTAEALSSELFGCFGSPHGAEMMMLVRITGAILALPGIVVLFRLPGSGERPPSLTRSKPSDQSTRNVLRAHEPSKVSEHSDA